MSEQNNRADEPLFILDLMAEEKKKKGDVFEEDIENMLAILENFGQSEVSRLNVEVSEEMTAGKSAKVSHHGRCDVGSPWARGDAFDVLEDSKEPGCK